MACQIVWNYKLERWEWTDLSYILGKTDIPDPCDNQPIEFEPQHPALDEVCN